MSIYGENWNRIYWKMKQSIIDGYNALAAVNGDKAIDSIVFQSGDNSLSYGRVHFSSFTYGGDYCSVVRYDPMAGTILPAGQIATNRTQLPSGNSAQGFLLDAANYKVLTASLYDNDGVASAVNASVQIPWGYGAGGTNKGYIKFRKISSTQISVEIKADGFDGTGNTVYSEAVDITEALFTWEEQAEWEAPQAFVDYFNNNNPTSTAISKIIFSHYSPSGVVATNGVGYGTNSYTGPFGSGNITTLNINRTHAQLANGDIVFASNVISRANGSSNQVYLVQDGSGNLLLNLATQDESPKNDYQLSFSFNSSNAGIQTDLQITEDSSGNVFYKYLPTPGAGDSISTTESANFMLAALGGAGGGAGEGEGEGSSPSDSPLNVAGSVVALSSGKAVAVVSVDPSSVELLKDGQPLPVGSMVKNSVSGQKFLKKAGDQFAFVAVELTPKVEWSWSADGAAAWEVLQSF